MSILNKLFKKEEDDFSLDSDFSATAGDSDFAKAFSDNSDPFSNQHSDSFSSPAPNTSFDSSFDTPNTTGMPQRNPMPPLEDPNTIAPTRGSQMARDYISRQQASFQPSNNQSNNSPSEKDHTLEIINLKLDAIKSQLEMLNQRLDKVEEKKKLW